MQPQDTTVPTFIKLGKKAIDLTGKRFGRLIALGPIEKRRRRIMWLCACNCGNTTIVDGECLRYGQTRSCTCLRKEISAAALTTRGIKKHPLYPIWCGMINRCANPKNKSFDRYGGRGITVCDEWRCDFKAFRDYATQLLHCREKGYTLDRIDNLLGYQPGNIRFATSTEQNRNKRNNRMLTYNGKTQCLPMWAEELGIKTKTLENRVRVGWSDTEALTTPVKKRKNA